MKMYCEMCATRIYLNERYWCFKKCKILLELKKNLLLRDKEFLHKVSNLIFCNGKTFFKFSKNSKLSVGHHNSKAGHAIMMAAITADSRSPLAFIVTINVQHYQENIFVYSRSHVSKNLQIPVTCLLGYFA